MRLFRVGCFIWGLAASTSGFAGGEACGVLPNNMDVTELSPASIQHLKTFAYGVWSKHGFERVNFEESTDLQRVTLLTVLLSAKCDKISKPIISIAKSPRLTIGLVDSLLDLYSKDLRKNISLACSVTAAAKNKTCVEEVINGL